MQTKEDYLCEMKSYEQHMRESDKLFNDVYLKLPYPFQEITLSNIVELSSRINVGDDEITKNEQDNDYVLLLYYIKFLGYQIEEYFNRLQQVRIKKFEYLDIYMYIRNMIYDINKCMNKIEQPIPKDIIAYLNQDMVNADNYHSELTGIINLLSKEKEIDDTILPIKSKKLLDLLESNDEIDNTKKAYEIKGISLEELVFDEKAFVKRLNRNENQHS